MWLLLMRHQLLTQPLFERFREDWLPFDRALLRQLRQFRLYELRDERAKLVLLRLFLDFRRKASELFMC